MGGEGSMMQANNSQRNNRSLLKDKVAFGKRPDGPIDHEPLIDHKRANPEMLKQIRTRLSNGRKVRLFKIYGITGVILLALLIAMFLL